MFDPYLYCRLCKLSGWSRRRTRSKIRATARAKARARRRLGEINDNTIRTNEGKADRILNLPCDHSLCQMCVMSLLRTRQRRCPFCRKSIPWTRTQILKRGQSNSQTTWGNVATR